MGGGRCHGAGCAGGCVSEGERGAADMEGRATRLDNSDKYSDRADPLRALSRAIARGKAEILQRSVQGFAQQQSAQRAGDQRARCDGDGSPVDLTARCEHCGQPLPARTDTGRRVRADRKYCGSKCRDASSNVLVAEDRCSARQQRRCERCGKDLSGRHRVSARFCTVSCGRRHRYATNADFGHKECKNCGAKFRAKKADAKFCSLKCSGRALFDAGAIRPPVRRRRLTAARFDAFWR